MISEVASMLHFVTCLAREFACNELRSPPPTTHTHRFILASVIPIHFLIHSVSILDAYYVRVTVLAIGNKVGTRPEHHQAPTLKSLHSNRRDKSKQCIRGVLAGAHASRKAFRKTPKRDVIQDSYLEDVIFYIAP